MADNIYLDTVQYLQFCVHWAQRHQEAFQTYHDKSRFQKMLVQKKKNKTLSLTDILESWYGPAPVYYLFHTTNSSLWWVLEEELRKTGSARDLRGDGVLGRGFYLSPNPRIAFLYGSRTAPLFPDKLCFLVFSCRIRSEDAAKLIIGRDFIFHDRETLEGLGIPVNSNRLQHIEITMKTQAATSALRLVHTFHISGKSARDLRWMVQQRVGNVRQSLRAFSDPPTKGPYPNLLGDVIFECVQGFGTIYHIHQHAKFIIFEGTIKTFLHRLQHDERFVQKWRSLIVSMKTSTRIHFNKFSTLDYESSPAKCFLLEGYTSRADPGIFFTSKQRAQYDGPMSFLSTSSGIFKPVLIVPPYTGETDLTDIYHFALSAPYQMFAHFFSYASQCVQAVLGFLPFGSLPNASARDTAQIEKLAGQQKNWFMNFHGGSVGWLHLRLDAHPAYYLLEEYELLENRAPKDFHCPSRRKKLEQREILRSHQQSEKKERLRPLLDSLRMKMN